MENLETSKIRQHVLHYFATGKGIDIGCSRDPITTDCVAFDRPEFAHYPEVTHHGDARALSFPDAEFDFLWSSHCLEDLEDTQAAIREWLRVLKPGGTIGLYVPHPDLYAKYGSGNTDHKHPGFTPEQLTDILLSLNCEVIESWVDADISIKEAPHYSSLVVARKK